MYTYTNIHTGGKIKRREEWPRMEQPILEVFCIPPFDKGYHFIQTYKHISKDFIATNIGLEI